LDTPSYYPSIHLEREKTSGKSEAQPISNWVPLDTFLYSFSATQFSWLERRWVLWREFKFPSSYFYVCSVKTEHLNTLPHCSTWSQLLNTECFTVEW